MNFFLGVIFLFLSFIMRAEASPLPQRFQDPDQPAIQSTKTILNLISLEAHSKDDHHRDRVKIGSLLPEFRGKSYLTNIIDDPKSPEGFLLRHVSFKWDKKHHQSDIQIFSIFWM